jgi:hypothetical protein
MSTLLAESPDRRSLEAISLENMESDEVTWQKFMIPPGTTATPLMSDDTVALILKGKSIDQVAAFSRYTGKWSIQRLLKPAEDGINPRVGPGAALYPVGNDIYAFSSRRGTWGVLHLEGGGQPNVALYGNHIEVLQGNTLYVFSFMHGRFSSGVDVNPRPFRSDPQQKASPAK